MAMAHQKEKGAIIGYVLVGALLTTALAGGVYVMRHGATSTSDTVQTAKTDEVAKTDAADTNKKEEAKNSSTATPDDKTSNRKDSVDTVLKQQADKNKADNKKTEDKKPTEVKTEQKTDAKAGTTTTPAPAPTQTQPSNQANATPATTPTTSTSPNSGLPHRRRTNYRQPVLARRLLRRLPASFYWVLVWRIFAHNGSSRH